MDEPAWRIRLRAILDEYLAVVAVTLLVVVLVAGYWTATTYGQEETRIETEQVASWDSTAAFTHNATVINGTDVYDRGTVLENRRNYFREITPRLNGSFQYWYTASDGGDLRANASTVLVLRSVAEAEDGNETEYWRIERTIDSATVESLSSGDRIRVPFSLNVSAAAQRLDAVDAQFGTTPGQKELIVETRLHLSGTRNDRPVDRTRTYQAPISVSGNVYQIQDPGTVTDSGGQSDRRTVTVEPGPVAAYGGPAILVGTLAVAGTLGAGRYAGYFSISDRERDWLEYRNAREEFDDWITVARVPDEDEPDRTVTVETLDGLVDIAIDIDQRVLEDRANSRFLVFDTERTYAYTPPVGVSEDPLSYGNDGDRGSLRTGHQSTKEDQSTETGDDGGEDDIDVEDREGDGDEPGPFEQDSAE